MIVFDFLRDINTKGVMISPVLKIYRSPRCLLEADKQMEARRGKCSLMTLRNEECLRYISCIENNIQYHPTRSLSYEV